MVDSFYEEFIYESKTGPIRLMVGLDGNMLFAGNHAMPHGDYTFTPYNEGEPLQEQLQKVAYLWYAEWIEKKTEVIV